jgi:DNA-directed RNA polymerase subunit RPC12/RpoP
MILIALIAAVILGIFLVPRIARWARTVHCPKCGKWFCLKFHSFVVTDSTMAQRTVRTLGGSIFEFLGLSFLGRMYTREDPYIREWGEARYICRACGRHISIRDTKRDR